MKYSISKIILAGSLIALTACGGGSGGDTTPNSETTVVSLTTADSGTINLASTDLQGAISTACYTNNSNGVKETVSINATTWTYSVNTYPGDSTCSSTPTTTTAVATLSVGGEQTVGEWVDGNSQTAQKIPTYEADPSTELPTEAPYTVINGEVTSSNNPDIATGISFSTGYVIDNSSVDGVTIYRVKNTTTGETTTVDPFTNIPASSGNTGGGSGSSGGANLVVRINSVVNTSYDTTEITYTVRNVGDTLSGAFQVMGWHNRASTPDYGSAQSGKFNNHGALPAYGGSSVGVITVDATTVVPGSAFNAYVIADYAQEVGESNEGLTGTNDNLSHMAWTVKDIFEVNNYNYIETPQQIQIKATYENNIATRIMVFSFGDISSQLQFVLTGEVVPGTYSTASNDVALSNAVYSSTTYSTSALTPATTPVTVTINQAGAVGELITGSYSAQLCSNNGRYSCLGVMKTFTGTFSMIRDPDA